MSKKSVICTILALTLILAGTGYAYWTDALNVTTKATTGDFDVTFVDLGLYAQYENEKASGYWSIVDGIGERGYVDSEYFMRGQNYRTDLINEIAMPGTIDKYYDGAKGLNSVKFDAELVDATTVDKTVGPYAAGYVKGSDNILITVDNLYPGYAQAFRSDILNAGSIAAKLSNIDFEVMALDGQDAFAINETTKNMLGVALLVERELAPSPYAGEVPVFELCKSMAATMSLDDSQFFKIGGVDFLRLSALDGVTKETFEQYSQLLALPSENRMDLFIAVAMDPDAAGAYTTGSTKAMKENDDTLSQNTGAQISVNLLWDQFNEGIAVDTTNILAEQNR